MMQLLILGSGCAKCAKLHDLTAQAARELGVAHELQKVTDLKQIMALRVMLTPALVVNGSVKLSGKVPSLGELKGILSQTAAEEKTGN
ncbi:MAG: thioredoxin family protein [Verrucomicrobiota bacterium]|jgi:small redox-active disulfide protein 2